MDFCKYVKKTKIIFQKVSNIHIKLMTEDILKLVKLFSVTLDRVVEDKKKIMAVISIK